MPYIRNTNNHGINPTGNKRIPAGAVVEVSDDEAKQYDGLNGVESVSDSDAKEYQEANSNQVSDDRTGLMEDLEQFSSDRVQAKRDITSAPLQRVVGDDQAPYGPPTGTITTKHAVGDPVHFGPHEARDKVEEPAEALTPHGAEKGQVVHNRQAENVEQVEERAQSQVERRGGSKKSKAEPKGAQAEQQPASREAGGRPAAQGQGKDKK